MHRAVLQACLPWFIWLCVASGLVLLLVQFCGGRCDWRRLRRLGRGEEGAVQSLSLVLTLPVFLLLVLFIVQITQIMIGIMMVNYAAFAAARAASVWIPADVSTDMTFYDPPFDNTSINVNAASIDQVTSLIVPRGATTLGATQGLLEPANVVAGSVDGSALPAGGSATVNALNGAGSYKYQKVQMAAMIPCLTISPSRSVGVDSQLPAELQNTFYALSKLYPLVDPQAQSNQQMPTRLMRKLNYAAQYTTVDLKWQNVPHPIPDTLDGPTYNPYEHPAPSVPPWNPNEVGFRDPVTVSVTHQFALLPGIGHILWNATDPTDASKKVEDRALDPVASRIVRQSGNGNELYTIQLEASATFVNEGFKSVIRYVVQP